MPRSVVKWKVTQENAGVLIGRGWRVVSEAHGVLLLSKKLKKWEKFEMSVRELLRKIGLEDTIDPENFGFMKYGDYQLDACGGIAGHFVLIDCTTTEQPGERTLRQKIKDFHNKQPDFVRDITSAFRGKYAQIHFAICTKDILISNEDISYAEDRNIRIIPFENLKEWVTLATTRFPTLAFQFMEYFAQEKLPIPGGRQFKFLTLKIPLAAAEDGRSLYAFAATPTQLMALSYVFRLGYKEAEGYQRPLKIPKLKKINHFLTDDLHNGFPNNIIVAFDEAVGRKLKFEPLDVELDTNTGQQLGVLSVPAFYGIAEVIDGQHRLFGYFDFTHKTTSEPTLITRQQHDSLLIVAYPDPNRTERPRLFLDINSNQTKISIRQTWAMMARSKSGTHMGYIARVLIELNKAGPLRGKIQIPGETIGKLPTNIANLGKGIQDRHLVEGAASYPWNLFEGVRGRDSYPETPSSSVVRAFNDLFAAVKESALYDWTRGEESFVLSNNGLNVLLRVYSEILKFYRTDGRARRVNSEMIKRLISPVLRDHVRKKTSEALLRRTSNEAGREAVATEMIKKINAKHHRFALDYLAQHRG